MKESVIFITGNTQKFAEAKTIIPNLIQEKIDLPEIQEIDPRKIIAAKLTEARKIEAAEFVVEDNSLFFECLGNLPGPLIKWFLKSLGNEGLYNLTNKYKNSRAKSLLIIGYINREGKIHYFQSFVKGMIVRPTGQLGFGWDPIFQPDGFNKTYAEMTLEEKNRISMRGDVFRQLKNYLEEN